MRKYEFAAVYDPCTNEPSNDGPCLIVACTRDPLIAHCEMLVERLGGKYYEVELEYDENFNYHLACVSCDKNGAFLKACLDEDRKLGENEIECPIVWVNN